MRILHVITGLAPGGAERQLAQLLRHTPHEADVLTLTNPGLVAAEIRADGRRVAHLGMAGNRDLAALPRLVRFVRAGRYDVVHTHLFRAGLYGRLAARLARVPAVVATEHSVGTAHLEGRPLTPAVRGLYRAGERLGDLTVAVSRTVADRLLAWGIAPERIAVVPNGLDVGGYGFDPAARLRVRHGYGIPADAPVVGTVGRLVPGKRLDVLLRAAVDLPGRPWLLLVGTGMARPELERLAARLGVTDRVRFTGEVDDVAAALSAMDVYAAPSPEETFGLGVVEALANGLPVVYVACPALEDLPPARPPGPDIVGPDMMGPKAPGEGGPDDDAVARAVRVPLDVTALRDGVAAALPGVGEPRQPVERSQPSPLVRHYAMTRCAAEVMALYERLLDRAGPHTSPTGSRTSRLPVPTSPGPTGPAPTGSASTRALPTGAPGAAMLRGKDV